MTETPPDTSTHWSTRSLAKHLGIGKDTVAEIWRDHQQKDPPGRAVVFSFDEKTQCQALDGALAVRCGLSRRTKNPMIQVSPNGGKLQPMKDEY